MKISVLQFLVLSLCIIPGILGMPVAGGTGTQINRLTNETQKHHKHSPAAVVHRCLKRSEQLSNNRLTIVRSVTLHEFLIAVQNDDSDYVSKTIRRVGFFDLMILGVIQFILLDKPCNQDNIVLDIGANVGFFGMSAWSLGCKVIFAEPQSALRAALNASLCLNRISVHHAYIISQPISDDLKVRFPVSSNHKRGDTGSIGIHDCSGKRAQCVDVDAYQLDNLLVSSPITFKRFALIKIDVEGYEPGVILSAARIIKDRLADNILMELTVSVEGISRNAQMLQTLFTSGYSFAIIPQVLEHEVQNISFPYNKITLVIIKSATEVEDFVKNQTAYQLDIWASLNSANFERYNSHAR